jgi:hypothetical protein
VKGWTKIWVLHLITTEFDGLGVVVL